MDNALAEVLPVEKLDAVATLIGLAAMNRDATEKLLKEGVKAIQEVAKRAQTAEARVKELEAENKRLITKSNDMAHDLAKLGKPVKAQGGALVHEGTDWQGVPAPADEAPETVIEVWSIEPSLHTRHFDYSLIRSWQEFITYIGEHIDVFLERFDEEELRDGVNVKIKVTKMPKGEYEALERE